MEAAANSPAVREAVEQLAIEVRDYWRLISPVFDARKPEEHRKKPPHGEPGDYQKSINYTIENSPGSNVPVAIVAPTDFKKYWIEYGTRNGMPAYAPMAKVLAKFRDD